jgi:hypothetical protein
MMGGITAHGRSPLVISLYDRFVTSGGPIPTFAPHCSEHFFANVEIKRPPEKYRFWWSFGFDVRFASCWPFVSERQIRSTGTAVRRACLCACQRAAERRSAMALRRMRESDSTE